MEMSATKMTVMMTLHIQQLCSLNKWVQFRAKGCNLNIMHLFCRVCSHLRAIEEEEGNFKEIDYYSTILCLNYVVFILLTQCRYKTLAD